MLHQKLLQKEKQCIRQKFFHRYGMRINQEIFLRIHIVAVSYTHLLDNQDYIGLLVEQGIMNDSQRKIYDDYKKFSLMAKKY